MNGNVVRIDRVRQQRSVAAPQDPAAAEQHRQQLEAERSVLGGVMLGRGYLRDLDLAPEQFFFKAHGDILRAALLVQAGGMEPDLVTISEQMRKDGTVKNLPDGYSYLAGIMRGFVAAPANWGSYVKRIRRLHDARRVVAEAGRLVEAVTEDAGRTNEALGQFIAAVAKAGTEPGTQCDDYERDTLRMVDEHLGERASFIGALKTGFPDLDRELVGLVPGSHLMLGARSEAGKSTLALNIAVNVAKAGRYSVLFGLEMSRAENFYRVIASESEIETAKLMDRTYSPNEAYRIVDAANRISRLKLLVFEEIRDLEGIVSAAHMLKSAGRLDLLIVDHIHLVNAKGESYSRNEAICRRLRELALELQCVVMTLAQFPDGVTRGADDKRPDKNWLQGGGFMHQLPSHILLLHAKDRDSGLVEAIVAKNRASGRHAVVPLAIKGLINRFESWSNR